MYTLYEASFWQFNLHINQEFNRKYTCAWEHASEDAKGEVMNEVKNWLSETTKDCPRSVMVVRKCYNTIFPSIPFSADSEEVVWGFKD